MFGPDHPLEKSAKQWVWALAEPLLSPQVVSPVPFPALIHRVIGGG